MKTIQEVIREMDPEAIEKAFFYKYPVKLQEMPHDTELTVDECRNRISERFQSFLGRLKDMEKLPAPDKKQGILFVHKTCEEFSGDDYDVDLIHMDELLAAEDVSKVTGYAYEFSKQEECLGFLIADNKLTQDNLMEVVVSFLYELSFFGYEQENLQEKLDELDQSMREAKEHPESLCTFDADEFRKEFGLPEEEIYPKEKEYRAEINEAIWRYTSYCRGIELERIKRDIEQRQ